MMKKLFSILLLMIGIISLTACSNSRDAGKTTKAASETMVPTLFFHGYGSSTHAENQMAESAVRANASKTIIKAMVDPQGQVTLIGTIPESEKNPIVEVGFENNRDPDYHQDGKWAKQVIVKLRDVYHIKKFNVVAHSMGNMAVMFYMLNNYQNKNLPKLQKQVNIAGNFNGILEDHDVYDRIGLSHDGRPLKLDPSYRMMLPMRKTDAYKNVEVLNIYGDKLNGSHSDGDVSNSSSRSLKYLIGKQAKSYQEKKIVGPQAQHSKLHNNKQVYKIFINSCFS
ncbi:alpha/beta hydrolase [Companilactobacillus versmoldensis]